uniref:uncharacterized protein LOC120340828 n=1 Tax=Styela clava TaxID=7725 RepID=UPI001939C8A5|nr:uncharacterized protein LOC120340828 [Styela clava]
MGTTYILLCLIPFFSGIHEAHAIVPSTVLPISLDLTEYISTFGGASVVEDADMILQQEVENMESDLSFGMRQLMSTLIGFRAKFLVEVNATAVNHKNLDLLQAYLELDFILLQYFLEDTFCDLHNCENGGECLLKPLDELLTYDEVLHLQSELFETMRKIYKNPIGFWLFLDQFSYVPGKTPNDPQAFQEILPSGDVAIFIALSIGVGAPDTPDPLEMYQYDFSSIFNGETLAILGKILDIMAHIVSDKNANLEAIAATLVECSCENCFSGSKCENIVTCNNSTTTENSLLAQQQLWGWQGSYYQLGLGN